MQRIIIIRSGWNTVTLSDDLKTSGFCRVGFESKRSIIRRDGPGRSVGRDGQEVRSSEQAAAVLPARLIAGRGSGVATITSDIATKIHLNMTTRSG